MTRFGGRDGAQGLSDYALQQPLSLKSFVPFHCWHTSYEIVEEEVVVALFKVLTAPTGRVRVVSGDQVRFRRSSPRFPVVGQKCAVFTLCVCACVIGSGAKFV
jgi:hypothetical protein